MNYDLNLIFFHLKMLNILNHLSILFLFSSFYLHSNDLRSFMLHICCDRKSEISSNNEVLSHRYRKKTRHASFYPTLAEIR